MLIRWDTKTDKTIIITIWSEPDCISLEFTTMMRVSKNHRRSTWLSWVHLQKVLPTCVQGIALIQMEDVYQIFCVNVQPTMGASFVKDVWMLFLHNFCCYIMLLLGYKKCSCSVIEVMAWSTLLLSYKDSSRVDTDTPFLSCLKLCSPKNTKVTTEFIGLASSRTSSIF